MPALMPVAAGLMTAVAQLGLKCERYMDADAVKFEVLSDDYQKLVFLRTDRQLEFHVKYGKYYTTRLPRFGRDLSYSKRSCELYCACSGPDVYRLHLEQGRYLKPFETKVSCQPAAPRTLIPRYGAPSPLSSC